MWPISGRLRPVTLSSTRPVPLTLLANAGLLPKAETEVVPGPTGVSLHAPSASAIVRAVVMFRVLCMLCFSFVHPDGQLGHAPLRVSTMAIDATSGPSHLSLRKQDSGEFPTNMEPTLSFRLRESDPSTPRESPSYAEVFSSHLDDDLAFCTSGSDLP